MSEWRLYPNASVFLGACQSFLMSDEALNNMILASAIRYIQNPPKPEPIFAVFHDGRDVKGALIAALDKPILSTNFPPEAAVGLSEILRDHPRADVMAPEPGSAMVARVLEAKSGQTLGAHGFQMQVWRKAQPVAIASGQMRRAWLEDTEALLPWMPDSALASGQVETPEQSAKFLNEMIISRKLFVWTDQGHVVSMAGFTGTTLNGVRIVTVYTPPEKRKRGYARSLTLKLSELQKQLGKSFCVLFTDPENPTSNKIYQEIGYQPLALFTYYFAAGVAVAPVPTGGAG